MLVIKLEMIMKKVWKFLLSFEWLFILNSCVIITVKFQRFIRMKSKSIVRRLRIVWKA